MVDPFSRRVYFSSSYLFFFGYRSIETRRTLKSVDIFKTILARNIELLG